MNRFVDELLAWVFFLFVFWVVWSYFNSQGGGH